MPVANMSLSTRIQFSVVIYALLQYILDVFLSLEWEIACRIEQFTLKFWSKP